MKNFYSLLICSVILSSIQLSIHLNTRAMYWLMNFWYELFKAGALSRLMHSASVQLRNRWNYWLWCFWMWSMSDVVLTMSMRCRYWFRCQWVMERCYLGACALLVWSLMLWWSTWTHLEVSLILESTHFGDRRYMMWFCSICQWLQTNVKIIQASNK